MQSWDGITSQKTNKKSHRSRARQSSCGAEFKNNLNLQPAPPVKHIPTNNHGWCSHRSSYLPPLPQTLSSKYNSSNTRFSLVSQSYYQWKRNSCGNIFLLVNNNSAPPPPPLWTSMFLFVLATCLTMVEPWLLTCKRVLAWLDPDPSAWIKWIMKEPSEWWPRAPLCLSYKSLSPKREA